LSLTNNAGKLPPTVNRQQHSPDKLINVIIFYRFYEISGNSAIGDACVFVIKYFTHLPWKPVHEVNRFRSFTAINDRKIE
jgi:hypothetical protein